MSPLHRRYCLTLFVLSLAAGMVATFGSCASTARRPAGDLPSATETVIVRLSRISGRRSIEIGTASGLLVQDDLDRAFLYPAGAGGGVASAEATAGGRVRLQGLKEPADRLTIRPERGGLIVIAGRRYRGEVVLTTDADGLLALNRLPLDEYLYGVLPGEVPSSWPAAALEAQAIAARSYALHEIERRREAAVSSGARHVFDLHDDVRSQVYEGYDAEDEPARAAVDTTHGQALLFAGQVVHCYFHSTCGGHTADASQVLGEEFTLPLAGRPCGHCRSSKYYEWDSSLDRVEAREALEPLVREAGASPRTLGELRAIHSGPGDRNGRLLGLIVEYQGGHVELPAPSARLALGPSKLRSLACQFRNSGADIFVRGNGWGHGVGLCQIGAKELSEDGRDAGEIVTYYYPGATISVLPD